jgi:hypothetical protein
VRSRFPPAALAALILAPGCRCERNEDEDRSPAAVESSAATAPLETIPLLDSLRDARRSGSAAYRPPTPDERAAYTAWVRALARAAWTDRLPTESPPEGFAGRLALDGSLWVLLEQPTQKRGAGLIVVRPGRGSPLVIEAPHTFFDEGTLEIALLVFHGVRARALIVNTMHRFDGANEDQRQEGTAKMGAPADVAHDPDSFFTTGHGALLAAEPSTVLQLHGFADATAPGVMAVVSAAKTSADVHAVARALRDALGDDRVRTYPDEIDVLGGTTNAQAKVSRKQEVPFIHLELSRTLRRTLLTDPVLAERFVLALRGIGEEKR